MLGQITTLCHSVSALSVVTALDSSEGKKTLEVKSSDSEQPTCGDSE